MALEAAAAATMYQQDLFGHTTTDPKDLFSLLQQTFSTTDSLLPTHFKNQVSSSYNHNDDNSYFLENQSLLDQFDWSINNININNAHHYDFGVTNIDNVSPSDYISPAFCLPLLNDQQDHQWVVNSSPDDAKSGGGGGGLPMDDVSVRRRRRRARVMKNKEDVENQRMTHIAVERNRRKQMNEYLNVLRSLMPESYVPRGDQASIVGGAINFVKELEQHLQCLSSNQQIEENLTKGSMTSSTSLPFQEFLTCPQYSIGGDKHDETGQLGATTGGRGDDNDNDVVAADVEVTMVESHANLKIRLQRPFKKLSKLVSGLLCLRLTVLHLNVNTADGTVFYSLSLKVEDDCNLSTVDDIAGAVYNLIGRIQEKNALGDTIS